MICWNAPVLASVAVVSPFDWRAVLSYGVSMPNLINMVDVRAQSPGQVLLTGEISHRIFWKLANGKHLIRNSLHFPGIGPLHASFGGLPGELSYVQKQFRSGLPF